MLNNGPGDQHCYSGFYNLPRVKLSYKYLEEEDVEAKRDVMKLVRSNASSRGVLTWFAISFPLSPSLNTHDRANTMKIAVNCERAGRKKLQRQASRRCR